MVRLTGPFSRLGMCKVLVIGDFLLDTYTIGKARRISPEAPVAVVQVQREEHRPGGAGNVVLNLVSMGCEVNAIGRIGQDQPGSLLIQTLAKEKINVDGMKAQPAYQTPVKNRIIAENQQVVRVDHEEIAPLPEYLEQQIIDSLSQLLADVQVIAISDYGKGFLTRTLLNAVIEAGRARGIPIIADPKGIDFTKYQGSTIIKPNLSEIYAAAGMVPDDSLELAAAKVLQMIACDVLMVTRSEAGISLFYKDGMREDFPVRAREVKDVTGAGDTVLAMLTCGIANGLSIAEAVQLSNIAAGIAIERFGCARVTLSDLARRLLEQDVVNKVFDEDHLFALQEALKGHPFALLGISGEAELTPSLFHGIRQLSQKPGWDLLVYVKDRDPQDEFVDLLASLHDVDFILVKGESLLSLCQKITPDEVYEIKDNALEKLESVTALL
jgi:rfaE bifunctional protein kinase chain/domain